MKRLIRTSFSALLALIPALGIGVSAMASSGPPPGFEGPQGGSQGNSETGFDPTVTIVSGADSITVTLVSTETNNTILSARQPLLTVPCGLSRAQVAAVFVRFVELF